MKTSQNSSVSDSLIPPKDLISWVIYVIVYLERKFGSGTGDMEVCTCDTHLCNDSSDRKISTMKLPLVASIFLLVIGMLWAASHSAKFVSSFFHRFFFSRRNTDLTFRFLDFCFINIENDFKENHDFYKTFL